jgi:LDH2 family malate/lactate/ureidoglycolate dehydrogenase
MIIGVKELEALTKRAVRSYGYTSEECDTITDVLMYAQLRGNNQGVVKLLPPGIPRDEAAGEITITSERPSTAVVDGARNHAMVVVTYATRIAIEKARASGVATIGVNGISTSSGAIGYYARMLAAEGLIGLVFAGAPPSVAPHGSHRPLLGTNPLAIGLPSDDAPIVLDLATAAMALYGVIEARAAGGQLPDGVAVDADGVPTRDPAAALAGAIQTFDRGPKSSGLSFMVQALAGPLVGASYLGIGDVVHNWGGHLIVGIDPEALAGAREMTAGVSTMVAAFHAAAPSADTNRVMVPGERGDCATASARDADQIDVGDALLEELRALAS